MTTLVVLMEWQGCNVGLSLISPSHLLIDFVKVWLDLFTLLDRF